MFRIEKGERNWKEIMSKGHPYLAMNSAWEKNKRKDSRVIPSELLYQLNQCVADLIMTPSMDHKIHEEEQG